MRKVRARLGSILLSLAMLLSLLPMTALAAEGDAYTALKAAVEAAPTNGTQTTVTLTGDISGLTTDQILEIKEGQNIVLDMDGHSITVASDFEGRPIWNYGTLTVTGNGTIDSSASNTGGYGAIDNYGTLTIQNGTYTGSVNASGASIKNRPNGVLTIEDGTFNGAVTAVYNEGSTKIYGGLFDCRSCSACNSNSWGYTIQSHKNPNGTSPELYFYDGTVIGVQGAFSTSAGYSEIHGGTFKTVSCEKHANGSSAWYALYVAGEDEDVKCVVYDGYFESVSKTTALIGNDNTGGDGGINADATTEIKGGTFVAPATQKAVTGAKNTGNPIITGGTFSSDVSDYIADGYTIVPQGDQWVVGSLDDMAVAQIGDTYYLTLAKAVEAAKDNDTIELLKTTEGGGVQVNGDGRHITIDLNGFTYTVVNPTVGSTGTETNGFQLLKGTDVTFKNGTIKPGTSAAKILIQNYCNLTLDNVTIDCSGSNCEYVSSNNCGNVVIKDSRIIAAEGQRAFDLYYWPSNGYAEGVSVTVEGDSEISGIIEYGSDGSETGKADLFEKAILTIKSGKFAGKFSTYKLGADGKANISITGGVFSSDPSAYLASGYAAVDNSGDTVYQYKVVQAGQNPAQVVTGEADVSVSGSITNADEKALAGEVVSALNNSNEKPDIGEALKAAAGTVANQNTVTKEQGKDALTNAGVSVTDTSNVTIVVQPYLEISVAAVSIQSSTKTVTLDITPMYITVATTDKNNIQLGATGKNAVQIGDAQELTITKPVTVTIPLTEGFVEDGTLYVKHVKDNGSTYYYKGSVKNNVLTFTNPNGFSLFSYSTSNSVVVADINGQGYASLADAITAVEKGGTIELLADNLSATVSREISFTVTGEGVDTVRLSAGSGYKMQQVGNTYTFTYIGTDGGGSSTSGYLVSVDSGKNGKVTVSPQRAEQGETVIITVKPDEGYELKDLTVTDKNGDSVKVSYKDDNKYTFKMPGSAVTVEATFQAVKEESPVDAFLDINTGAWYYDAVKYAVENGLMSGTGTYTFEPNTTLSRAMIAQMLYALEGKPSVSAANSFTDVSSNDWYAKAASWAQSKGIITGYEDGSFRPDAPLTREQLALILFNYSKIKGYDTSDKANLNGYLDGSSTSTWAQEGMTWAVGAGLLSGRGLNMLYPTGTATRAEVAQIMMNFCENVAK